MKIKETIERECCQEQDLMPYGGIPLPGSNHKKFYRFCKHCGQLWSHWMGDAQPPVKIHISVFAEEQRKYA